MNVLGELGLGACHMLAVTMSPVTGLSLYWFVCLIMPLGFI
jgi:hypothetical protein